MRKYLLINKINPYYEIITNKIEKDIMVILQMEQWSILHNIVNYVQYDRHLRNDYDLNIKAIDQKSHKRICSKEEERQILDFDFGGTPEKIKGEYLNMYEGIQLEMISTTRFYENLDLSTIYLGRTDITEQVRLKQKRNFLYQNKDI